MMKHVMALLLTVGCTGAESTGITASTLQCPTDSTLTYETFGESFISDNCLECHASKEKPLLNTQAQVQANASKILEEAVYTTAMPEDGSMTTAQREMLGEWIKCGTP